MGIDENAGLYMDSSSESSDDKSHTLEKTSTNEDEPSNSSGSDSNKVKSTETKAVNYSKRVVYLVILLAAVGMSAATYNFTKKDEQHNLEQAVSIQM